MQNKKVLMVGAGGIGCELLKNLVLSGFIDIEIVDLDTIDLSNLNRQFLFRKKHINQPKAKIAAETATLFNPNAKIIAHHKNIITDPLFSLDYFMKFDIVLNALDNLTARRHVNKMCLAAGVPLYCYSLMDRIESGTAGLMGQVSAHIKGVTECFDCTPHPTPKTFPVCTIRSTPSQPIHFPVYVIYPCYTSQLFGSAEEEDPQVDSSVGDQEELQKLENESNTLKQLRNQANHPNYAQRIFDKVFHGDIKRLAENEEAWKLRQKPIPLDSKTFQKDTQVLNGLDMDHQIWSITKCYYTFLDTCTKLGQQTLDGSELEFDKDNEISLDFITAASNLRSHIFHIAYIIPAIATTNAIIAGLIVLLVFQVLEEEFSTKLFNTTYLTYNNPKRFLSTEFYSPPNPYCSVCSCSYFQLSVNPNQTLESFINTIVKGKLNMNEVSIFRGDNELIYDFDLDENLEKTFQQLQLTQGKFLTVVDDDDEKSNACMFIKIGKSGFELLGDLPVKPKMKRPLEQPEEPVAKEQKTESIVIDLNNEDTCIVLE